MSVHVGGKGPGHIARTEFPHVGGGIPDWVPTAPSGDRPLIYADFVGGNYWAAGAVSTVEALFFSNPDFGSWDPAAIVPGQGILTALEGATPNVQADLVADILTEKAFTSVVTVAAPDVTINFPAINMTFNGMVDGDFVYMADASCSAGDDPAGWSLEVDFAEAGEVVQADTLFEAVAFAVTVHSDQTVGSMNGAAVTSSGTGSNVGGPTFLGLDCEFSNADGESGGVSYVTSWAIYQPQPDADLPTLSTVA